MKRLSLLLIFSMLLPLAVGCYGGEVDVTTAESTAPETSVNETTLAPETDVTPDVTEAVSVPETTTLPDTTAAPETTLAPETTEPPVIIPQASVTSFDELKALAADDKLEAGTVIRITQKIEIESDVVLTVPVTLSVQAEISGAGRIVFSGEKEGVVEIMLASGVDASDIGFVFDIPNCDLLWLNGAPYADDETAAEAINVRSYNGVDLKSKYGLGGNGAKRITTFILNKKDNSALDSSLEWTLSGNVLYTAVSYLVDMNALKDALVSITLDDGSVINEKLDLTVNEQQLSVPDDSGNKRTYKVITDRITYNLPVFYIEIENGAEVTSKEDYLRATVRVDASNAVGDFPSLAPTEVNIRGRGHFSWQFDKTPYKLKFDSKVSVMGMAAAKDWVLLANYVDRSLIQNYVALEMGKVMSNIPYHSTQYPVDVFVNGTYRGVYTFGEQLEVKKARINLEESYTEPDTDYLLEIGGGEDGDVLGRDVFHSYVLKYVKIKHPESDKMTQEQIDYLIDYVNKADLAVMNLSNYEDYIDVDSLIDWVIIHELTYNLDCCFRRSCYLIKEKGGKLKMGPIWDFDLGFGNYRRYTKDNWATVGSEGGYVWISWMNYLMKDDAFMKKFTDRWNEVKTPLLTTAITSIETMYEIIKPSADVNFEVWDILGKDVLALPASHKKYDTYEKMIGRLKDFLNNRYQWIDKQLNP